MSDEESDAIAVATRWVWSGFCDRDAIEEQLPDVLEDEGNAALVMRVVDQEFERKRREERGWPAQTDCDRLDTLFEELNRRRILAFQNAGYTIADGESDIA